MQEVPHFVDQKNHISLDFTRGQGILQIGAFGLQGCVVFAGRKLAALR
jgi:hypothetical protein